MPLSKSARASLSCLATAVVTVLLAPPAAAQGSPAPPGAQLGYVARAEPRPRPFDAGVRYGAPAPADAPAPRDEPGSSTSLDLGVVTQVPILIGGELTLELPHGLLLQGDLGVLPGAYVSTIDDVFVTSGAYDEAVSDIVRSSLTDSLVMRLSGGVRPFAKHGLELMGGYTLTSLGGGLSARQAIEAATSATLPAELGDAQIPLRSTIHSVHASVGFRWLLGDHVALRAQLGYMQAVASSSRVDLPAGVTATPEATAALAAANGLIQAKLDDVYTTYVKLPVVGLSASYRF